MKAKILFLLLGILFWDASWGAKPWDSRLPRRAQENAIWHRLVGDLLKNEMYYGALAAADRMLLYFSDLPTKELAYQTIIEIADRGYPFSIRSLFISGDIIPQANYHFDNSYNLYKGIINQKRSMEKWANYYFQKVDQENFDKYMFFLAIELYQKKELDPAAEKLKTILARELKPEQKPFIKKISRTLARIYYEQTKYKEAFEIYETFLLKTNPIQPDDWVEAAWNAYFLKDYPKALGYLYNLESKSVDWKVNLEKYVIRALIYKTLCATKNMTELIESFEKDYGGILTGIKRGTPLIRFKELRRIYHEKNKNYYQIQLSLDNLQYESNNISALPSEEQSLAQYLYRTSIRKLKNDIGYYKDEALRVSAENFVMLAESLKFLEFDVIREIFNPDTVFIPREEEKLVYVDDNQKDHQFRIHWIQMGDYWRDERLKYTGKITSKCAL